MSIRTDINKISPDLDYLFRLTVLLFKQQLSEKYARRGLGLIWIILNPLLQLSVFLIFFSIFFSAKWTGGSGAEVPPVSGFIVGLLFYWALVECLSISVNTVRSHQHIITKVVFPIIVFPLVNTALSLTTFFLQTFILFIFLFMTGYDVVTPLMGFIWLIGIFSLFILGVALLFAWLGAVFRDLSHLMSIISLALMFLSPIFFSMDALPEWLHMYFKLNPLTFFIEEARLILFQPSSPLNGGTLITASVAVMLFCFGGLLVYLSGRRYYPHV